MLKLSVRRKQISKRKHDADEDGLRAKIKKINDLMYKFGNQELKKIDLTFSQFHALVYLEHCENGEATLKQLEAHFKVAQATMAGIISRLECKGYVKGAWLK